MNNKELLKFLVQAKKQTYANVNAPQIASSRLESHDYEYINGELKYHDTYFGGIKFIGEEVVYLNDIPVWAMNYYGVTIDATLSEEAMDKALRPALMRVGEDTSVLPLRGSAYFKNDSYEYSFASYGEIGDFTGDEKIHKEEQLIYRLKCHGGFIK